LEKEHKKAYKNDKNKEKTRKKRGIFSILIFLRCDSVEIHEKVLYLQSMKR